MIKLQYIFSSCYGLVWFCLFLHSLVFETISFSVSTPKKCFFVIFTVYTLFKCSYSIYTLIPNTITASASNFAMPLLTG